MSKFKTQMSTVQNRKREREREEKKGVGEGREGESEVRNLFAGLLLETNQRFGVWGVRLASIREGKLYLAFSASVAISYPDSDDSSL